MCVVFLVTWKKPAVRDNEILHRPRLISCKVLIAEKEMEWPYSSVTLEG